MGLEKAPAAAQVRTETDAALAQKLAQKLGQLQPFLAVLLQECLGQFASFSPTERPSRRLAMQESPAACERFCCQTVSGQKDGAVRLLDWTGLDWILGGVHQVTL